MLSFILNCYKIFKGELLMLNENNNEEIIDELKKIVKTKGFKIYRTKRNSIKYFINCKNNI